MKKIFLSICLLIIFLTNGCQNTDIANHHESYENSISNSPTNTLTSSGNDKATEIPTVNPEPAITITPLPTKMSQQLRIIDSEVLDEIPQQTVITGVIVAGIPNTDPSYSDGIYLLDAHSGEKISDLPPNTPQNTGVREFSVSPNGKLAVYFSSSSVPKNLYVINNKGEVLLDLPVIDNEGNYLLDNLIPGEAYWTGTAYWLDDESFVIEKWPWDMSISGPVSAIYFKPFIGTAEEFQPVYPNISTEYNQYLSWQNGGLSIMSFNPTMTRVLYLNNDSQVVLYDLENNSIISQYNYPEDSVEGGPIWFTDGSKFVINILDDNTADQSNTMDIYEVSRDGESKRLTYFEDFISDYTLRNLTWSPDGEKIAFLVDSDQTPCGVSHNSPYLGVFEYDSPETVKLYCYETFRSFRPIWSPDSQKILLETRDLQDYTLFPMLLIDTEEDYVAVMNKNLLPVGWMASE